MKSTHIGHCITGALLVMTVSAQAQAQFTEKYPQTIPRANAESIYFDAAHRKVSEIFTDAIKPLLQDPLRQAKMAPVAIDRINGVAISYSQVPDRGRQYLALVNSDLDGVPVTTPAGPMAAQISFSARYNVARIVWKRDVIDNVTCKKQVVFDPVKGPYNPTVNLSEEAEYTIRRNGKVIARITGAYATSSDRSVGVPKLNFGSFSIKIKLPIPIAPNLPGADEDPVFYDLDPYQGNLGEPLSYTVTSTRLGCGNVPDFVPFGDLGGTKTSGDIWLDANGDSVPDSYDPVDVAARRADGTLAPGASLGSFSYTGGIICVCGGQIIPAEQSWATFVTGLDTAIRARMNAGISAVSDVKAALNSCRMTTTPCTVGKATVTYRFLNMPGGRDTWTLTTTP